MLAACTRTEKGTGVSKVEARAVGAFTEVDVATGIEVDVTPGPLAPVEVHGDDNLVPLVITEVDRGRLSVRFRSGASTDPKTKIRVRAVTPSLTRLSCSSGARLDAGGLGGDAMEIAASSGCRIRAVGSGKRLTVTASSGGTIDAAAVSAGDVEARVSAGAQVTVQATASVRGSASSGGKVRVKGSPARREVNESAGGSVVYE